MRRRRLLGLAVAGQLDAGLSSLATFGLQVYTTRVFTPEQLGAYALVFAAFIAIARVPAEIAFKPVEVIAVDADVRIRLGAIRSSLRPGLVTGAGSAPIVVLGGLPALGSIDAGAWWTLVGSAAVVTVLSPLQDHLRRMFHIADRSSSAVGMAMIQAVMVAVGAYGAGLVSPILVPFGALALANATSIGWGLVVARVHAPAFDGVEIDVSARRHLARWLLLTGVATSGLFYVGSAVLSALVGFAALGHIEAARVAARPIQVVSQGLVAVVGPRSMAAAARAARPEMQRWRRRYAGLMALVAGPYLLLTAFDTWFNPMSRLVPVAYVVPGLVAGMVFSYWLQATNLPMESEILGLRAARSLAAIALVAGLVEVAASFGAPVFLEYAAPLGVAGAAVVRKAVYRRRIGNILKSRSEGPWEE